MATDADAAAIRAIYAPFVRDTIVSFETDVPAVDELQQRISVTTQRFPWLVCDIDGAVAGFAYAGAHRARSAYRWSVDVAVYVDAPWRRNGLGKALYSALLSVLRMQGFANAFAGIALPNPASVALHEAMGFEPIGVYRGVGFKLNAWRDVGWWQHRLRDDAEPSEPHPVTELELGPMLAEEAARVGALTPAAESLPTGSPPTDSPQIESSPTESSPDNDAV